MSAGFIVFKGFGGGGEKTAFFVKSFVGVFSTILSIGIPSITYKGSLEALSEVTPLI